MSTGNDMNRINGKTRVCGLIGHPVEHTLSPLIHNTLASLTGTDLVYTAFDVEPGCVKEAVDGAFKLNILGLNVTVPHKIEVLDSLADIDPKAKAIGAVNTLVRTGDGYKGYNTDHTGLKRALACDGIELSGKEVVILGAGGAARAAAFLCAFEDAVRVYILNRNYDRAVSLCRDVNTYVKCDMHHNNGAYSAADRGFGKTGISAECELCKPLRLDDHDKIPGNGFIVIQASSVGLYPNSDDVIIPDCEFYDRIEYGFDAIYKPAATRFMSLVKQHGGKCSNGLKMLLYQGIAAFELWNETDIDARAADEVCSRLERAAACM